MVISYGYIALAIAASGLLGYALGRYRASSFQNRGEARVSRALQANFAPPDYHLLNHITLKFKGATTQVDHILISRFGIFVIETKDYKGWIFANATQPVWTQVIFGRKFKFQNPIFQNMRHVQAVGELLDFLPPSTVKSAVVFVGQAEFKTDRPTAVFTIDELTAHIKSQTTEVMSPNRMEFCVGRVETARLAVTGQTDLEHVESLQRRHGHTR
jgi:Nuclease-related domain